MNLVTKYCGAGSVVDRSVGGRIGRFFGKSAGVPSSIAWSATKAWNENKQAYAEEVKKGAARAIIGFGTDKIAQLHSAWATIKDQTKANDLAKHNLALSGLQPGKYVQDVREMDSKLLVLENNCKQLTGHSFSELDAAFGKFNSTDDFKQTAADIKKPLLEELNRDHVALEEEKARIDGAIAANRKLFVEVTKSFQTLGI